jgi:hypothetical protein
MTMVELLLQAERALSVGLVDQAEGLYRQVAEADPHNAIARVGLARVALERADDRTAYVEGRRALAIDPENAAAQRLVLRLEEVFTHRGEAGPEVPDAVESAPVEPAGAAAPATSPATSPEKTPPVPSTPHTPSSPDAPSAPSAPSVPRAASSTPPPAVGGRRRSLLDRLLGRGNRR